MEIIVTVDETWICLYTPEVQSTMWKTAISQEIQNGPVRQETDVRGILECEKADSGQCNSPRTDGGCRILYEGKLEYFNYYTRTSFKY